MFHRKLNKRPKRNNNSKWIFIQLSYRWIWKPNKVFHNHIHVHMINSHCFVIFDWYTHNQYTKWQASTWYYQFWDYQNLTSSMSDLFKSVTSRLHLTCVFDFNKIFSTRYIWSSRIEGCIYKIIIPSIYNKLRDINVWLLHKANQVCGNIVHI